MSGRPTSSRTRSNVTGVVEFQRRAAVLGFADDVAVPAQHRGDHAAVKRNVFDQQDAERRDRQLEAQAKSLPFRHRRRK